MIWTPVSLALVAIAGALGRRFAGGLLSEWEGSDLGALFPRAVWATLGILAGVPAAVVMGAPVWVGLLAAWPAIGFAIYGNAGRPLASATDWLRMLLHGACALVVPAVALQLAGLSVVAVAIGIVLTPGTAWIANRWPASIPVLGCRASDPGPTGELLVGALWGLAIAASAL